MRKFITSQAQDQDASVDITPMLDVVFIMLIFFHRNRDLCQAVWNRSGCAQGIDVGCAGESQHTDCDRCQ